MKYRVEYKKEGGGRILTDYIRADSFYTMNTHTTFYIDTHKKVAMYPNVILVRAIDRADDFLYTYEVGIRPYANNKSSIHIVEAHSMSRKDDGWGIKVDFFDTDGTLIHAFSDVAYVIRKD